MDKNLLKYIRYEYPIVWAEMKKIAVERSSKLIVSKFELKTLIDLKRNNELNSFNLSHFKDIVMKTIADKYGTEDMNPFEIDNTRNEMLNDVLELIRNNTFAIQRIENFLGITAKKRNSGVYFSHGHIEQALKQAKSVEVSGGISDVSANSSFSD